MLFLYFYECFVRYCWFPKVLIVSMNISRVRDKFAVLSIFIFLISLQKSSFLIFVYISSVTYWVFHKKCKIITKKRMNLFLTKYLSQIFFLNFHKAFVKNCNIYKYSVKLRCFAAFYPKKLDKNMLGKKENRKFMENYSTEFSSLLLIPQKLRVFPLDWRFA